MRPLCAVICPILPFWLEYVEVMATFLNSDAHALHSVSGEEWADV
jgi:hypothetical protein